MQLMIYNKNNSKPGKMVDNVKIFQPVTCNMRVVHKLGNDKI